MPRRTILLEDYRQQLINWQDNGLTHSEIQELLDSQYNIKIALKTLHAKLVQMGLRKHANPLDPESLEKVKGWAGFFHYGLRVTDECAVRLLSYEGFAIGQRTYRRLRKEMGLHKRISAANRDEMLRYLEEVIVHETAQGRIETLGRNHLYTYMRARYNIIGRDRIFHAAIRLNPQGHERRALIAEEHRGQLITTGPNEVWSMDAYCKFELWGIQVYGACDVYSRHLIWIYVGITARTALSVASQYLNTVAGTGFMPTIIRADKGAETPICANVHYNLRSAMDQELEEDDYLPFRSCFRFGTSRQNTRIEKWWREQGKSAMNRWRDCFLQYSNDGEYFADSQGHRIAFLAIYVPILREELLSYTRLWNTHYIRRQRNREEYLKHGIPHILYHYPEESGGEEMGIAVDRELVQGMLAELSDHDIHEFLPAATLQWCIDYLQLQGFPAYVNGRDTNQDGRRLHELAYKSLRDAAVLHIQSRLAPRLEESPKPYANGQWQPSAGTQRVFSEAGIALEV